MELAFISMLGAVEVTSKDLVGGFIFLLVMACVLALFLWVVSKSPLQDPIKQVLTWVLYLIAVLILVNFLLGLAGHPIYKIPY